MIYDGASYRINIEGADSTIILDSWTNTLKASIASSTGEVLLDEQTATFFGTFKGNIIANNDEVVFDADTKEVYAKNIHANLIDHFGNRVFDFETGVFKGNFVGDLYDDTGAVVASVGNRTWYGNVSGDVVDDKGNSLFANGMFSGDIVSNIYNSEGVIAFDKDNTLFYGNLQGNVISEHGALLVDKETGTFNGDVNGNLVGNIMDEIGTIVFNPHSGEFNKQVNGQFAGTFLGDIYNEIGEVVYNHSSESMRIKNLDVESADGTFSGEFQGNIVNPYTGDIKYDATMQHWDSISMSGYLYSAAGAEAYDPEQNIFSSSKLFTKDIVCSHIDIDSTEIGNEGIFLNIESAWSQPAIEAKFYRKQEPDIPHWFQQGIELCGVGGTWMQPAPSKPGDSLPALNWNATIQTGTDPEDSSLFDSTAEETSTTQKSVAAYITAKIPQDDKFKYMDIDGHGCSGELHFVVNNVEAGPQYTKIDKWGKLHTTLAEFKVDGETGVVPHNTSTPDSWLQMTVNGETKFIPLYS